MAKEKPKEAKKGKTNEKPKYNVKGGQQAPNQPPMTEEQAFMGYTNQVISNLILDMEATKGRAVDSIKSLIQQLSLYMNAVKKLEQEKKALEDKLKKK